MAGYPGAIWMGPPAEGNYEVGRRGYAIRFVIIHTTEGSAQSALDWFKNPASGASAHYIVRQDGVIWQVLGDQDTAYHAGNLTYNLQSIGIELEGWADGPDFSWQTPAQYSALQNLISWLLGQYGIPSDRAHLIGHNQVPGVSSSGCAGPSYWGGCRNHHDPGAWWSWSRLISGLGRTPNYTVLSLQTSCPVITLPQSGAPYITSLWSGQRFVAYDSYGGWYLIFLSGREAAQPFLGAGEYHWDGWVSSSCVSVGSGATQLEVTGVFPSRLRIRDGTSSTSPVIGKTIDGKRYAATGSTQIGFDGYRWYEYYRAWDTGAYTRGWSSGAYLTQVGGQPDLVVTSLSGPSTGTIGGQITVSVTVANQGSTDAGAFRLGFYFSTDSTITTGHTYSGWYCNFPGLAAGTTDLCSGPIGVPLSLTPGTYYLGAIADDLGQVAESNENNNARVADTGPIILTLAFDYTLSNSGPITVLQGSSGSNTITATLVSGTTQAVAFSASGLPSGATASFSPPSCSPTCSSTLTISTSASTPAGTFPITVTGSPLGKTTTFNLVVNPSTDIVTIRSAVFFNPLSLLFVSATSTAAPDAKLSLTVPGCVTDAPMQQRGRLYIFFTRDCTGLDGQTATVTSSFGGSAEAVIQ